MRNEDVLVEQYYNRMFNDFYDHKTVDEDEARRLEDEDARQSGFYCEDPEVE